MKAITIVITGLLVSLLFMSAVQTRVITGTVTDSSGYALIGVNVLEKGTSNNVFTDKYGKYSINVNPKSSVLLFSFPGMETKEVVIGNTARIDVQMVIATTLQEIIIMEEHETTMDQAESYRVAGVKVQPYTGMDMAKRSMGNIAPSAYHMPQQDWNTEGYATIHENGFKDVLHNPLSTFSIDVDRASYANVRRFINMGQMPPVDAVRIEEMINYFSYDYPEPDGKHPFTVTTELSECPWNGEHQLLRIGLKGKDIEKENLPPSNLVFLLDVSGSMSDHNKLPLLKSAFRLLVKELRKEDRVAIVVYAGAAGVVLESTPGNEKAGILAALEELQAGGSTAGGAGIKLAYKLAEQNFIKEGNNRIILATDGDFNIGQSSDAEMERLIETEREKGIFITVLGFGMGNYKDSKMEVIADKGNGNYAYIDNIQEANKVLVSEFGGTLFIIAKDVKFQIEFNPARVKGYRLVGYENRLLNDEDFNDDKKDAGEMGAGHTVTALYEIIPAGAEGEVVNIDPLKYQQKRGSGQKEDLWKRSSDELMTVKLRYKKPDESISILYELPVKGDVLKFEETTDDFRFAAAVAQYGMLLRNSDYLKQGGIEDVIKLAGNSRGADEEGYRGEFIRIIETTGSLMMASGRQPASDYRAGSK